MIPALILVVVACAAPWAFGSVDPRWWSAASAVCLAAAAASLVPTAFRRDLRDDLSPTLRRAALALPLVAALGLVPIPPFVRSFLSPRAASLLADSGSPAAASWAPISLDPHATLGAVVLAGACAAVFWIVGRAALDDRRRAAVTAVLLSGGFCLAAFGLVQRCVDYDPSTIYWRFELPDVATPFGPYVNRNHFAGAMLLFVGVGVGSSLHAASTRRPAVAAASGLAAAIALIALVATTSRGALVALAVGALFLVAAVGAGGRGRVVVWILVAAVVAAVALWAMGLLEGLVSRFHLTPEGREQNRFAVQRDALDVFAGAPLFGTGAGTFATAYPPFQTVDDARYFRNAHSDWAQFLMETGLVGAAFVALAARAVAKLIRRGASSAASLAGPRRWLILGPAAGCLAVCVHGFFDVGLHVPANALLFAVTLSIACGAADGRVADQDRVPDRDRGVGPPAAPRTPGPQVSP